MKQLVIATRNKAKFKQIKDALSSLDIELRNLADFGAINDFEVEESGKNEVENARLKALGYASKLGEAVLAVDIGLYIEGLVDDLQPGIYVRRFFGKREMSDEELLAHFSGVIRGLGGEAEGYWQYAVCLATVNGQVFESSFKEPRKLVWKPSKALKHGYPIESLQIDLRRGKYFSEISDEEKVGFWQRLIGGQLCEFVEKSLEL